MRYFSLSISLMMLTSFQHLSADNSVNRAGWLGGEKVKNSVQKDLKEKPDLIKELEKKNEPILHGAVSRDHVDMIRFLVKLGANPDGKSKDFRMSPPLVYAAYGNHQKSAKVLLELGADVNAADEGGYTALEWAASKHHKEIVKLLLEQKDKQGKSKVSKKKLGEALLCALYEKNGANGDECATAIITAGVDVNYSTKQDGHAIHLACKNNYPKALALMVKKGAKLEVLSPKKETPLEVAVKSGSKECVKILLDAGAKVTDNVMKAAEDGDNNDIIDMLDKHVAKKK